MTKEEQREFIADYLLIENAQERFSALVARKSLLPPLDESDQIETNRVEGCVSQVWLVGENPNGVWRFRTEADSTIVAALAKLIAEWFDGLPPEEIRDSPHDLLDQLQISGQLSPTRRRGMAQIFLKIQSLAVS